MENTSDQQKENSQPLAENELQEILTNPDQAENLSKDELVQIVRAYEFSGPLPPPRMLAQYEESLPGAADRIITMAESEQQFRHESHMAMIATESRDSKMGILSAGLISLSMIIGGIVVILCVPTLAGTITGGIIDVGGIATIIGTYLSGTTNSWKNKKNE